MGGGNQNSSPCVGAKLDDINRKDGLRKYRRFRHVLFFQKKNEREVASVVASLLGLAVSDLWKNKWCIPPLQ